MIQLVIKDGRILATHAPEQDIQNAYPDCEIIFWNKPLSITDGIDSYFNGGPDPRTDEEKLNSYKDKRRLAYPPIEDQLDMIYWDKINDTFRWIALISAIKTEYPKSKVTS